MRRQRNNIKKLTDFESKVLQAVRSISKGKVTTYKYIAKKIGQPKAYRAVANALKKNPFLIKIPCHRVIRSSGELGGYILGAKRKLKILRREGIEVINNKIKNQNKILS